MSTEALEQSDMGQAQFHLVTDEQEQLRKEIREFAAAYSNVSRWDEASVSVELVKELGRMGLMGVIFPQQYGGSELGYVEYVIAIEELSRVDGSIGIIVACNSLAATIFFLPGRKRNARNM